MTVEDSTKIRARKHYAIYVYPAGTKRPAGDPQAMTLCPQGRTSDEPVTTRWQAVTCQQCIGIRKTLRLAS